MKTHDHLTKWIRLVLAAAMAIAVGLAITPGGTSPLAEAADVVPDTLFEIDGDPAAPNDFDAPYGPGLTPGGFATTGLYYNERSYDEGLASGCDIVNDPSTATGGVKIDDGPVWASPGTDPNGKTDLDFVDIAAEKVDKDGAIFDIIYVGYRKCGGQGTWQTTLYLDDGDGVFPSDGDDDGDFLFLFEFQPSTGNVDFRELRRVGGTWVAQPDSGAFIDGFAEGDYGEVALNVTELLFRDDQGALSCNSVVVSGPVASVTGGSFGITSQPKDLVGFDPLPIDNCGSLDVLKAGPSGTEGTALFGYDIIRAGGTEQIHDASLEVSGLAGAETTNEVDADLTEIDGMITVGGAHSWTNVLAATDFEITETLPTLPAGWAIDTIECSYRDLFQVGAPLVAVTIYENGAYTGNDFTVPPATLAGVDLGAATCTMTNEVSGIIVAKETLPDGSPTDFPFEVSGGGTTVTPSLADGDSTFIPFVAGTPVTITEGVPNPPVSPGFILDDVTCLDGAGQEVGTPSELGVQVTVGNPDNVITCTFTNIQQGRIIIDKQGLPADAPQAFDFTISGPEGGNVPVALPVDDLTIPGDPSAPRVVRPGTYTVEELEPPFDGEWRLVDIACDNEVADSQDLDAQTVKVDVGPGETVNCVFTNNQRGSVTIDKTAVLVDPSPVAGTIDQFDVQYTVTATSESYVTEDIVVDDSFDFPSSLTVVGDPSVSGASSSATWNGDTDTELYSGPIGARGTLEWVIDVRVQLDLDAPTSERDCNAGGSGAWNDVFVRFEGVIVDRDDACVSFGDPIITVDKNVVGDVTVNPDQTMSVTYSIDVENTGDGPGAYELSDDFGFPTWVTVTDVAVTPPTGVTANPTFDGDADQAITTGPVGIAPGADAIDTYQITVTFTAAPTATGDGVVCGQGPGEGLFNLASITSTNGPDDDSACIDIPRGQITVTKATFGDTGSFDFSSTVPGTLIDGGIITTTTDAGAISGNTLSAFVTPGSYEVTEAAETGWTQIATPCGDTDPAVVTDGGSVSCDFVNGKQAQIRVEKIADPAGTFEFVLAPAPGDTQNVNSGSGYTWTGLDAGDFTLTETVVSPWQLVSAACDGNDYANGDPISVDWGDDITCVFSNEAMAEIIVEKQTLPDGATQAFTFSPSYGDDFSLADGQTNSSGLLAAGEYTITELATDGWDFISVDCVVTDSLADPDNGSSFESAGNSATVTLEPGDTVTCTFDNTQRGEIIVNKTIADGTAVGDALLETFDFALTGDFDTDEAFTLDGNGDDADGNVSSATYEVRPGAYSVDETVPADWQLDGVVCTDEQDPASLTVEPGATVECTFTNSPDPADVEIDKTVVNVASDYAWSFDFTIDPVPAGETSPKPAAGVGPDTVTIGWTDLIPGQQYTITETVPANWTQSGLVCDGIDDGDDTDNSVTFTATPGLSLSCSVTNTPDNPTLVVNKTTVGGVGLFDFTVTPENDQDELIEFSIQTVTENTPVASATYELLSGLSYDVDETDPGAAWAEGTLDCGDFGTGPGGAAATITVAPGDVVECSISNSALGNITVIKETSGGDGTFGFNADPAIEPTTDAAGDFSITTTQGDGQVDFQNLQPGQYVISEIDPTAEFDGTDLTCTSSNTGSLPVDLDNLEATIDLSNGETVVCVFTNTERARIVVDKVTNPSGDPTQFTFTETWTPDGGSFQLADGDAPVSSGPIPSNTEYELGEAPQPGWVVTSFTCTGGANDVTYDVDVNDADGAFAQITPLPGETILCTVTNNLRGPVTVTKVANPDSVSRSGATYTVVYDLTVETESYIDEPFTLTDTPGFASGVDITSVTYTDASDDEVALPLAGTIAPGETLVYTATFEFTIDGDVALNLRDCAGTGTATFNSATVTYDGDRTSESNDCVDLPDPDITQTKTAVASPAQPVYLGGNAYSAAYRVVVKNDGEGPGSYTLVEAPDFGAGVTITAMSATSANGVVAPGFKLGSPTLANDVDLQADQSDTYVVTVRFTIDATATLAARNCTGEPGSGAYNEVSISVNGDDGLPADACIELPDPAITIVKTASAGQPVQVSNTEFTAEYKITVDNVGDGPGAYDLVDTPAFGEGATVKNIAVTGNGVSIDQATAGPVKIISGETINPDEAAHVYTVTVTFEVGSMTPAARTCSGQPGAGAYNRGTVTFNGPTVVSDNDCVDIPETEADLAIVKTASVAQIGAGGGFDWILDITNNGPATAVNVVIGDLVPSTLTVTGVASSDFDCGNTGNDVECTVGSLAVGASGTVTISVTVPATTAGGDVTNIGTVESDTPDPDLTNNSDDATVIIVAIAPPTTTLPPVTLPKTGSDATQDIVRVAMMLVVLGGAVVLVTRRRRDGIVVD